MFAAYIGYGNAASGLFKLPGILFVGLHHWPEGFLLGFFDEIEGGEYILLHVVGVTDRLGKDGKA